MGQNAKNKPIFQAVIILITILLAAGSVLAEPAKKGKKQKLTKQQIKKTLQRIENYDPELAEELRDIRKEDPKLFRKKIKYMRNQWSNKKQHGWAKGKKFKQYGKGHGAFGNKSGGRKQCGFGMKGHRGGKRGMKMQGRGAGMKKFGRGQRGMGHGMGGMRQGRRQRGMGQRCQNCGADFRGRMMGQGFGGFGMRRGMGRQMGNRGPRQFRHRQW